MDSQKPLPYEATQSTNCKEHICQHKNGIKNLKCLASCFNSNCCGNKQLEGTPTSCRHLNEDVFVSTILVIFISPQHNMINKQMQ